MYTPDLETFCRRAAQGNLVPVFRELPGDLDTPVSVFYKLKGSGPAFLLESVEGGEQLGRYSFIGANPSMLLRAAQDEVLLRRDGRTDRFTLPAGRDPLHVVAEQLARFRVVPTPGLPRFFGGAVGYLAYDMVRYFEPVPTPEPDELGLPDALFMFTDTIVIFDHVQHKIKVVSNASVNGDPPAAYRRATAQVDMLIASLARPVSPGVFAVTSAPIPAANVLVSNFTREEFAARVVAAKEYIAAGDAFQIVLSQRLRRQTGADAFAIYRALRMLNPSPYMFYLELGDFQLIGSSPEMLVKLEEGKAETRPIAGTRPRGKTPEEDEELKQDLMADPKELAEHVMLVDLGRNDVGRVCQYGTVRVPTLMTVEKYSHVMHIVSAVEGRIRDGRTSFDLVRAAFPAGTVSGAPKIRAMEIINELEGLRRGPYSGAVGYFGYDGNMDTCITIRTIVMKGDMVYLQAGGGIVADSDPYREHEETINKSKALARAVQMAEEEGY